MDDQELDLLRQKRMAELQKQSGGGASGAGANAQQQEEMKRQQTDMKNSILSQVLTQEARARCKKKAEWSACNPVRWSLCWFIFQ